MTTFGGQVRSSGAAGRGQDTDSGQAPQGVPAANPAMPTNILSIRGGLGNQLFEWAFAHSLASRGSRVVLDTVRCRDNRPLEIGGLLRAHETLARPLGYAAALAQKAGILSHRRPWTSPWHLAQEPGFAFDPDFVEGLLTPGRRSNYVLGYFQSPKYFAGYETQVRSAVSELLRGMLTESGRRTADRLADSVDSVAVHVRRGDYVSNPVAATHHGTLRANYYRTALEAVRDMGKDHVIWFSDDTEWVRAELARPGDTVATPSFTSELTAAAGGEIALMASCSSRVIANSSFSWWAGWLGRDASPDFPVIAPRQWFAGTGDRAADLVPEAWTRI